VHNYSDSSKLRINSLHLFFLIQRYCSAFSDVDAPFGSRGSFFSFPLQYSHAFLYLVHNCSSKLRVNSLHLFHPSQRYCSSFVGVDGFTRNPFSNYQPTLNTVAFVSFGSSAGALTRIVRSHCICFLLQRYCSAFSDVDAPFGSRGSFFSFRL